MTTYDNLGEATDDATVPLLGGRERFTYYINAAQGETTPTSLYAGDLLLAQSTSAYDADGQVYESQYL